MFFKDGKYFFMTVAVVFLDLGQGIVDLLVGKLVEAIEQCHDAAVTAGDEGQGDDAAVVADEFDGQAADHGLVAIVGS